MIRTVSETPRVLAAELPAHAGGQVRLQGWLHRHRSLKSVAFLILRDRSGLAQIVSAAPAQLAIVAELAEETVLVVVRTGRPPTRRRPAGSS